jgi:hypothetical protein
LLLSLAGLAIGNQIRAQTISHADAGFAVRPRLETAPPIQSAVHSSREIA